jgi:uncharacterized membrane protein (Fun14 family)
MAEHDIMESMMQEGISPVSHSIPTKPAGILDTIKSNLSPDTLMEKVKSSKDRLFEIALYGGIGFISGFLLKKYSTYVGICILLLIGLGVLHHLGVIHILINWDKVNEFFGIQAVQNVTADNIIATIWEWVKVNMAISISYIVGFFIGLKVG